MTHGLPARVRSRLARFSPFARFSPLPSLLVLLAVGACSSVIGIEDLHEGPPPGGGGDNALGGNTGVGGDLAGSNGGASSATGGSAGKGPGGGSGGAGATGATGATGGTTTGGSAGDGAIGDGGAGPAGTSVHGHVIDYWGHALPQIPVQIGDTLVTTDANGAFTVDEAPATYDVGMTMDYSSSGVRQVYGWAFLGLTRRDPTLQVYSGLPERDGNIQITPTNVTLNATRQLNVALAGPDGEEEFSDLDGAVQTDTSWRGPAATQERAHGLLWQFDATSGLPTGYLGYDTQLVQLDETSAVGAINLNLNATAPVAGGNIAGTVTPGAGSQRENDVFVRFSSGASIQVAADSAGPNTFAYLVPTIANSSVTLAATEGYAADGDYAVVHKDGLAAGSTGITAAIPNPCKPLTPNGTLVDSTSQFTFTTGAGNTGPFVVSIIDEAFLQGLYVVTVSKTFKVPAMPGGAPYSFVAGDKYVWRVETHGNAANIDAITGSGGFLDEFSGDNSTPRGPHATSGAYTISQGNEVTAN